MEIKEGGQLERVNTDGSNRLKSVRIEHHRGRKFALWINESSVSYLTLEELLDLRDECNEALKKVL